MNTCIARLNDRVLAKVQYSPVNIKVDFSTVDYTEEDQHLHYLTAVISIIF